MPRPPRPESAADGFACRRTNRSEARAVPRRGITAPPAGAHPGRIDERGAAPFAGVDYDPQGHHPPPEPEPDPSDEGGGGAGAGRSAAVRARFTQTGAIARRYSADA